MNNNHRIKQIIWDWNGTLIDDVHISIDTINETILQNHMEPVETGYYRDHFGFPVRNFYQQLGLTFDEQEFDHFSVAFMDTYLEKSKKANLHPGALEALRYFHDKGIRQFILSAMEQSLLEKMLKDFDLTSFFDRIQGLENLHAHSKADAGKNLLLTSGSSPKETIMIGDTIHDFEVASAMGVTSCLVSCGHHTHARLEQCGVPVFENHGVMKQFLRHEYGL